MIIDKSIITKLPDKIDPKTIIEKKIDELNSVCPFCGENKKYHILNNRNNGVEKQLTGYFDVWYGKQQDGLFSWLKIWEKNHCWQVNHYECHSCGAEWKSEPFPTDITGLD